MKNLVVRILYFFELNKAGSWVENTTLFSKISNVLSSKFFLWALGILTIIFMMDQCFKETAREAQDPKHRNDQYFSGWDGSNPELVEYVKSRMNDPNSFEHVETKFYEHDGGDKLRIVMTYRGKNGFGGVVTERVGADLTKSTRTLSNVNAY